MRSLRFALPFFLFSLGGMLRAQNGDVAGEEQKAPTHLEIPPSPVLVADEAIKTIKVTPGYHLEIEAADPLIGDPVFATYGPDGRLWVVEMRGFMRNPDGKGEEEPVGAIAVLEDTDHDGRMDRRVEFAKGLVMPRALALVGDGVLYATPPKLWFARDRNGDGVADETILVASDYGTATNPEHCANGLLWAMDNWIYSANHTVRFRYLGDGKFARDLTVSRGQWGISQDNFGRLYHDNNSDPLRYDLVPAQYLLRNPHLLDPAGANLPVVPADLRIWPLRVTPGVNRGYKTLDSTGRLTAVTAACAPFVYRGDSLSQLTGDAFVCEPAGNLVKRIGLDYGDEGVKGRNRYEGSEFLASTDERFRPVNLLEGPDGALRIVDMYRGIIQHRIYLTSFLRKQIEERGLADGIGMGRIYRVVPDAGLKTVAPFNLTKESSADLVRRLTSPGAWWRDTAQRLLVERRDTAAVAPLRALALDRSVPAFSRLHALWTLDGIEGLDQATLFAALDDPDTQVTAAAIRLSQGLLAANNPEALKKIIASPTSSTAAASYTISLQRALSLGESPSPDVFAPLLALARQTGNSPYLADAIVSGLSGREAAFVQFALGNADIGDALKTVTLAASCVWRADDANAFAALNRALSAPSAPAWAAECLVASYQAVVPKRSDGKQLTARLAEKPTALLTLTAVDNPRRASATALLEHLRWPGNEGPKEVAIPLNANEQKLFEKGRTIYTGLCAGCHQPNGQGLKGLAPSLVTSSWVAGAPDALVRIVLHGKASEGLVMPPLQSLDDESIAGALTFVRHSWGHGFSAVGLKSVADIRQATTGRAEPWSDKELKALSTKPEAAPSN